MLIILSLSSLYAGNIVVSSPKGVVYFVENQRYVCINRGVMVNNQFIPTDQEEALKYPIRFYVDETNIFHTDAGLMLPYYKGDKHVSVYAKDDNVFVLAPNDDMGKVLISHAKIANYESDFIYSCVETENWTLGK